MPGRVLAARAGVIVGPHENIGRLPRWLWRLAEGGDVLAPGPPEAPMQLIDARDLARLDARHGRDRPRRRLQRDRRPGSATWGELLEAALGGHRRRARAALGRSGVDRGAGRGAVGRAAAVADPLAPRRSTGCRRAAQPRPGWRRARWRETVADTWAWLAAGGTLDGWRSEVRASGLSGETERGLLAALGIAPKPAADTRQRRSPSRSRVMLVRKGLRGAAYEGSRGRARSADVALVEAGAGIRAVLQGESVDRTHDRQGDRDGDESDHATIIGHCAP